MAEDYNVSSYSDEELFQILGLHVSSSDFVLEGRLLHLIDKYHRLSADSLHDFFCDVYSKFFSDNPSDVEGFSNKKTNSNSILSAANRKAAKANLKAAKSNVIAAKINESLFTEDFEENEEETEDEDAEEGEGEGEEEDFEDFEDEDEDAEEGEEEDFEDFEEEDEDEDEDEDEEEEEDEDDEFAKLPKKNIEGMVSGQAAPIPQVEQVSYVADPLQINPFRKQVITTQISIDSRFRRNINETSTTDFYFDLERPLRNVVSMCLFSVQIPYNWYTINSSFGSNFFYIKGNNIGIYDEEYKIEIPSGNYGIDSLVSTLNASIQSDFIDVYTEMDLSGTSVKYFETTTRSAFNVSLSNLYTESSYQLDFPSISNTSYASMPDILNLRETTFSFYSIYSKPGVAEISSTDSQNLYTITALNNSFKIVQFLASSYNVNSTVAENYYDISGTILHEYDFSLGLEVGDTVSRFVLQNSLLNLISINEDLLFDLNFTTFENKVIEKPVNVNNESVSDRYNVLSMKLNRRTTKDVALAKTVIIFSDEGGATHPIWSRATNDETITSAPSSCAFDFPSLIMEFGLIQSESVSDIITYTLSSEISFELVCTKIGYSNSDNDVLVSVAASSDLLLDELFAHINSSMIADLNTSGNEEMFNLTNSSISYNTSSLLANFEFDINKVITQSSFNMYLYRLDGDAKKSALFVGLTDTETDSTSIFSEYELDNLIELDIKIRSSYTVTSFNNLITIIKADDIIIDRPTKIELYIAPNTYQSVSSFLAAVQRAFTANSVFTGTECTLISSKDGMIKAHLTIRMAIVLTEKDYKLVFYDSVTDASSSWGEIFHFDSSYNLVDVIVQNPVSGVKSALVVGNTSLIDSSFRIKEDVNDSFTISPIAAGVTGNPIISFVIPESIYSASSLLSAIQELLRGNTLTAGSECFIDSSSGLVTMRLHAVKEYTAQDYTLVFYDPFSFVNCNIGVTNTRNITEDSTLGFMLGFHSAPIYFLNGYDPNVDESDAEFYRAPGIDLVTNLYWNSNKFEWDSGTKTASYLSDVPVSINSVESVLIVIDDFCASHAKNEVVTVLTGDSNMNVTSTTRNISCTSRLDGTVSIPTLRNSFTGNRLTQNQIFASQTTLTDSVSARNNTSLLLKGPSANIFGIIPLKLNGLKPGSMYIENGSTLQSNKREYFGPVTIHRLRLKLLTDKGIVLDVNQADINVSLLVDQIYSAKGIETIQ